MKLQSITAAHVAQELAQCRYGIEVLAAQKRALEEKEVILERLLVVQTQIENRRGSHADMPSLDSLRIGTKPEGKPDTEVLEEILAEYGPLHISDIITIGRERGVSFIGKTPPKQAARNKLNTSQRFVLIRSNVWGLPAHVG